jgi:hypothetical protein
MLEFNRIIGLLENQINENNKTIQGLLQSNQVLSQALTADKVLMLHDRQTAEATGTPSRLKVFFNRLFRVK